jgi:hypothetical protein
MGGFFIRPKSTNLDKTHGNINAEAILPAQDGVDSEYIPTTGFDPSTDGKSGAEHRRDPVRREAEPSSPLPSGGWRGPASRTSASGFGKGTRAGKTGTIRGK